LKLLAEAGWQRLAKQPDLEPAHEALLLKEHYRELARTQDVQKLPPDFRDLLAAAEHRAGQLEISLREPDTEKTNAIGRANTIFAAVTHDCTQCHQRFRDVPLGEKSR
jgi:hypothetical protein